MKAVLTSVNPAILSPTNIVSGAKARRENAIFKSILVATDGTTQSSHAVKTAARLAKDLGSTLTLFHATRTYQSFYYPDGAAIAWPPEKQYLKEASAGADKVLASASALVATQGVKAATAHASSDAPADAIIAAAKNLKADLIVMASHGRRGLDKLLMGSETQKVLAHTKLPVLVVR
jgi:nucleotide-binding universal stress UspA family protein